MKVLIIEDESLAAERLINLLHDINPDIEVLETIKSVERAVSWLKAEEEPDLIFSDIQLSDSICFDIFEEYKPGCQVIFTTAYDHYAIQAFTVNSIDYLLKPVSKDRLEESLEKYHSLKSQGNLQFPDMQQIAALITQPTQQFKTRFLVKVGNKIKSVPTEQIAYFYTHEKMTYIVDKAKNRYPIDHTLEEIDSSLNPNDFFRVNRKYVVRFESVVEIHPYFKGRLKIELHPEIDDNIVVSSDKTPAFKAWLDK